MSDEELQSDGKYWYQPTIYTPLYLTKTYLPHDAPGDLAAMRATHRKTVRLKCVVQGSKVVDVLRKFCEDNCLLFHEWNFETKTHTVPRTMQADCYILMHKNAVLHNTTVNFVRLDDKHQLWTTQSNTDESLLDCIERYCDHFKIPHKGAWTFGSMDQDDLRFCRCEAATFAQRYGLDHVTISVSHKPLDKIRIHYVKNDRWDVYIPTEMTCPVWLAEAYDWPRRRFMAFCMRSVPRLVKDGAPVELPQDLVERICLLSV